VRLRRQRPRSHRKIRSNCKKTCHKRSFRRAQHVGVGRKSRWSKKLKGGAQHFDPNVKPTRDGLGYKKDIELIHSDFAIDISMDKNYLINKVLDFFKRKKDLEENLTLDTIVIEAYISNYFTQKGKKFIRVKITPIKNEPRYNNRVEALLNSLSIEDFENRDIQSPRAERRDSEESPPPRPSKPKSLSNQSPGFGNENLSFLNTAFLYPSLDQITQQKIMDAINKVFTNLSLPAKQALFKILRNWFLGLNTDLKYSLFYIDNQKFVTWDENKKEFTILTEEFVKYLLEKLKNVPDKNNFILTGPKNETENEIVNNIKEETEIDFIESSF
jgi:hypothetical protein